MVSLGPWYSITGIWRMPMHNMPCHAIDSLYTRNITNTTDTVTPIGIRFTLKIKRLKFSHEHFLLKICPFTCLFWTCHVYFESIIFFTGNYQTFEDLWQQEGFSSDWSVPNNLFLAQTNEPHWQRRYLHLGLLESCKGPPRFLFFCWLGIWTQFQRYFDCCSNTYNRFTSNHPLLNHFFEGCGII